MNSLAVDGRILVTHLRGSMSNDLFDRFGFLSGLRRGYVEFSLRVVLNTAQTAL